MSSDDRISAPDGRGNRPTKRELAMLTSIAAARLLRLRARYGWFRRGAPRPGGPEPGVVARAGRAARPLDVPGWALTLGVLLMLLLFLSLLVVFFLPGTASGAVSQSINFDKATKDWYAGPVRYIITHQEVKAYKALDTELDRQNFIDWFWQRRDIEPATPENEFRDRFEQRVYEATRMFSDTSKPGWKTDMGKIYILVGPPDEINKDLMGKTHRGIVTWVYRKSPFPDLPANTVIGFARGPDGEFRISASPTVDSDVARGLKLHAANGLSTKLLRTADDQYLLPGRDPALLAAGAPLSQTTMQTMMVFGRMQQLPPNEEEMFRSLVTTKEFFGSIPADSRFDCYKGSDGLTYTTLTIGIRSSAVQYKAEGKREVPDVAVFGKLINRDHPDQVYPLASDSTFVESEENQSAGPDDLLIFQATGGFKPGKYQLLVGVQDRVSKRIASYRKDFDIPDYSGKDLTLSSITVAGTLEPTDYAAAPGKPFQVGKFHLVPRPDGSFARKDELNIYFQVYNPALDTATGRPRLDIVYAFRRRDETMKYVDVGDYRVKESGGQVQGYAVPLEKWPAGTYRVVVTVTDTIASASKSAGAEFIIRE